MVHRNLLGMLILNSSYLYDIFRSIGLEMKNLLVCMKRGLVMLVTSVSSLREPTIVEMVGIVHLISCSTLFNIRCDLQLCAFEFLGMLMVMMCI